MASKGDKITEGHGFEFHLGLGFFPSSQWVLSTSHFSCVYLIIIAIIIAIITRIVVITTTTTTLSRLPHREQQGSVS